MVSIVAFLFFVVLPIIVLPIVAVYLSKNNNKPYLTPSPTPFVPQYYISIPQPIYEITQGSGLVPGSLQVGFIKNYPVIQYRDSLGQYNIINFVDINNLPLNPSNINFIGKILKIDTLNNLTGSFQTITNNILPSKGLSNNSFEIGMINDIPGIHYLDNYNYKYLQFNLNPNNNEGNIIYEDLNITSPSDNTNFIRRNNNTNNIINFFISENPLTIFIKNNTLNIGYYVFCLINLVDMSIPITLPPSKLAVPALLWRNNLGYHIIAFWTRSGNGTIQNTCFYLTPNFVTIEP